MTTDDERLLRLLSQAYDDLEPPPSTPSATTAGFAALLAALDSAAAPAPLPLHRLNRRLAAAAASEHRLVDARVTNADGTVVTTVNETSEGTLLITISSSEQPNGLVAMTWTLVDDSGVYISRQLVTPLAADRSGWSARYDIGSVTAATAVDIVPADVIDVADVQPEALQSTLQTVLHGSARRAWNDAVRSGSLPAWIGRAIDEHLDR